MPCSNAAATRLLLLTCAAFSSAPTCPAAAQQDGSLADLPIAGGAKPDGSGRSLPTSGTPDGDTTPSATVVDRRQLNQRNVQTLQQALAYTPEASVDISGYDPRSDAIDIRGFDVTYTGIYAIAACRPP